MISPNCRHITDRVRVSSPQWDLGGRSLFGVSAVELLNEFEGRRFHDDAIRSADIVRIQRRRPVQHGSNVNKHPGDNHRGGNKEIPASCWV